MIDKDDAAHAAVMASVLDAMARGPMAAEELAASLPPDAITVTYEVAVRPEHAVLARAAAAYRGARDCRVYWGSHGCQFERGHEQPCRCDCCGDDCGPEHNGCAGSPPYYGPDTHFYGEDVAARGMPSVEDDDW